MQAALKLVNTYGALKFWAITSAIAVVSVVVLPDLVGDVAASASPGHTLWLALLTLIAIFGVLLPVFALWHHMAQRRFAAWLEDEWPRLLEGGAALDGQTVTLDTPFVRYQAVFSAVLATVSLPSRPYLLNDRRAGVAQASLTILTLVFGWWFAGPDGVVETVKALVGNCRSSQAFTLRQYIDDDGD